MKQIWVAIYSPSISHLQSPLILLDNLKIIFKRLHEIVTKFVVLSSSLAFRSEFDQAWSSVLAMTSTKFVRN